MRPDFSVNRFQAALLHSTCAIALLSTAPVMAQEGQAAQSLSGLESITVTARRVEEDIQRVPIAITAFSPDSVERAQIVDIDGLAAKVPSLNMCCSQGNTSYGFLRGATGVAYYFANTPIPTVMSGGFGTFFDVQNVQVLKGPQGTLFGTASNAGAILYDPVRPGWEFSGFASGTIGNYGRTEVEGAVTLPIMEDFLTVRLAAQAAHRDGVYKVQNLPGLKLNDRNWQQYRASVVVRPLERLENYTVFQYYRSHRIPGATGPTDDFLPSSDPNGLTARILGDDVVFAYLEAERNQPGGLYDYETLGINITPNAKDWKWHAVNETVYDITDDIIIKNIFSYYKYNSFSMTDGDMTPLTIFHTAKGSKPGSPTSAWSDELQVQGTLMDDQLTFTTGTFWYGPGPGQEVNAVGLTHSFGGNPTSDTWNIDKNRGRAFYGQATMDMSDYILDGLSVTAGYRYSWDTAQQINRRYGVTGQDEYGNWLISNTPNRTLTGKQSWKKGSYTVSLSWQATPDTMFFVTNSQGSGSGGLALTAPPGLQSYGPASLNLIEGGVKSQFLVGDTQVRFNATGFYGWYDDIAVQVLRQIRIDPPPATTTSSVVTENAATAIMWGVDYDIAVVPTDWFEVFVNGAYNHFHFVEWDTLEVVGDSTRILDLSSTRIQFTPKFKYAIGATVHLPIDAELGELSVSGDWTHQGVTYVSLVPEAQANRRITGITNPPFGNLNLDMNWEDPYGADGLNLTLYWTNVLGNKTESGTNGGIFNTGYNQYNAADPPMFGLKATYRF